VDVSQFLDPYLLTLLKNAMRVVLLSELEDRNDCCDDAESDDGSELEGRED
jgi:hypothetical protein